MRFGRLPSQTINRSFRGIPAFFQPRVIADFAEAIRKEAGILTGAVGMITDAHQAQSILAEGKADAVLLARKLLNDPYWPLHAAKELNADIKWPVQYERGK